MLKPSLAPRSAALALVLALAASMSLGCQLPRTGSGSDSGGGGSSASGQGGSSANGSGATTGGGGSASPTGSGGTGNLGTTGAGNHGGSTGAGNATSAGNSTGAASSGGATSQGGAGGSGGGVALSRGPTPPSNGTNFPFPQNRQLGGCVYPTGYDNNDVMSAYAQWKTDLLTSNGAGGFERVQRTPSDGNGQNGATPPDSTVSEGIGYGMLIAVYMGDRAVFDSLWKYEQLHLDGNGLMNWSVDATGKTTVGSDGNTVGAGGATDADEDMAFALVMADKQWGSASGLNYATLAAAQIAAIWNHEVYMSKLAGPGDSWGGANLFSDINISYFAPAYYRVFKQVDSGHDWDAVTQTVYDTIQNALNIGNKNTTNGLVPGWCTSTGGSSGAGPFTYQYDACRTPFRIGTDWCWNGSRDASAAAAINPSRAAAYVALTSSFFGGIGVANLVDGYNLDGSIATGAHTVAEGQSAAFIGPAAVGAMSSGNYQTFIDAAYARLKTRTLTIGGAYYDECWTMLSLLMLTGNLLDYTAISPAQ